MEKSMEEENTEKKQLVYKRRRGIRSYYRKIRNRINEERDELANMNSGKFLDIMNQVEDIHKHVTKPREQVADAETLLGLTKTLVASAKTHSSGGVTPAQFGSWEDIGSFASPIFRNGSGCITMIGPMNNFGSWEDIGSFASPIFRNGSGCITMIGPMNNELKLRKKVVRKTRSMSKRRRPKELQKVAEEDTDTVKNQSAMYDILKKAKKVRVENLILNRNSFAQTVENLFALSFFVKDGRVKIEVDENGSQFAVLRNGPSAEDIQSGEVEYHQFIYRLDFNDWVLMKTVVVEGEEVMPPRPAFVEAEAEAEAIPSDSELTCTDSSVKKPSRDSYKAFMNNWISSYSS